MTDNLKMFSALSALMASTNPMRMFTTSQFPLKSKESEKESTQQSESERPQQSGTVSVRRYD
jgi:hypothetical protein